MATRSMSQQGQWLRKFQAAAVLGISERAIDKRIAAGKLEKRTAPNGMVEIFVPSQSPTRISYATTQYLGPRGGDPQAAEVVQAVQHIVLENACLRAENERLKARLAELEEEPIEALADRLLETAVVTEARGGKILKQD